MANKTKKLIVSDIQNTLFVIPFYQRGYRWTGKNVKQLLSDLLSFDNSNEDVEYCLQPIVLQPISKDNYSVLKEEETVVRVVDGQQRLTTIAILLRKLGVSTTWDIYYDTEKKRLSEIMDDKNVKSSINDYFRNEVKDAIDEWLNNNQENDIRQKLKSLFLPNEKKDKRISFLEYDIETTNENESTNEGHETFLRLNDGKTPLTASELIKALYMVRSSGLSIQQQMEISKEWEMIENSLRNNQFWLMFNAQGLEDTPTRIDLLFALVLGINLREAKTYPKMIFDELEDEEKKYDLGKVWDEVLHTFWWMQSCYSDIELCNFLSWIRAYTDNSATTIYKKWCENPAHNDFKNCIIKIIQDTTFGGNIINSLDSVDYHWEKGELRKLFVLLNVLDCNKGKERFRFDLFNKSKGWDIEHIDSQTPNDFKQDKNKREWLNDAWNELTEEQKKDFVEKFEFKEAIETFTIENVELVNFESMADYIVELTQDSKYKLPIDKTHKLGNLALLNLSINRGYRNDIFPLKRKHIINCVNEGSEYIPPCTVKAFSKFYTESASKITSWQISDYEGYYKVMNNWFEDFMNYKASISDYKNAITKRIRKDRNDKIEIDRGDWQLTESKGNTPKRFEGPVSFPEFMDTYDVIIPKTQRTYVQGRLDKRGEKCLSGFASKLVESVTNPSPMLLDFVYGINICNGENSFYPLDGQQRLTTLLLLSWLCDFSKPNWTFKYESRRSTEIFVKELLMSQPPQMVKPNNYDELKKHNRDYTSLCKDYIRKLPWFHESWLCDACICGMLEMLDSLYDKLLNAPMKSKPSMDSIVFLINYLDVSKKSYDHIFLKMNSRGRELSEWDNINAVLNEFLPVSLINRWPDKIQSWYELMWNTVSKGKQDTDIINIVDNRMMDVVNLALVCVGYSGKSDNTFELSKWLQSSDEDVVEKFYTFCENFFSALEINKSNEDLHYLVPSWSQNYDPRIPDFACEESKIVNEFYQPLLAFYASEKSTEENWMRVIWNLVENIDVKRDSFHQAIHLIDELADHKDIILSYLSGISTRNITKCYQNAENQLQEEIAKAKQILNGEQRLDGKTWKKIIVGAEKYAFFKGTIRFLFTDGEGNINWCDFDTKWSNAKKYFAENGNGVKVEYTTNAILLRSFISKFNKWGDFWGINYDNEPSTWKMLLTSRFESTHCILTNIVDTNCDFTTFNASLKEFNNGFEDLQQDLVKTTILVEASKWNSQLNWKYNTYCLYPRRNRLEWKVYVIGNQRNQILSSLCDKKQIIVDGNRRFQSGDNDNFFWGWDIQFTYTNKNYYFQWHRNGYVRLIQDLNECKPILKNKDGEDNQDNWYWFTPSTETETFIKQLDCLIAQAYPNESDKTYCVNCQNNLCD